jgi:SAM-dependent methyltransferase
MELGHTFDFIDDLPLYKTKKHSSTRLNIRHRFLIEPFKEQIQGARVLDLAAHDGRWSYALSAAGAKSVVGIEGRENLVLGFNDYPNDDIKSRVDLRVGDIFDGVRNLRISDQYFDIIALYGIFYHIMDHMHLLRECLKLRPQLIIIDSLFRHAEFAMIMMIEEDTSNDLNATPKYEGQKTDITGVPSFKAMEAMARALDCDLIWMDWNEVPQSHRKYVGEYFKDGRKQRATCALVPRT